MCARRWWRITTARRITRTRVWCRSSYTTSRRCCVEPLSCRRTESSCCDSRTYRASSACAPASRNRSRPSAAACSNRCTRCTGVCIYTHTHTFILRCKCISTSAFQKREPRRRRLFTRLVSVHANISGKRIAESFCLLNCVHCASAALHSLPRAEIAASKLDVA